jgi:hypothetical protein
MPNTVSNMINVFAAATSVAPKGWSYGALPGLKSVAMGRKRGYYALRVKRS